ncbi:unnamed protein product [Sphagnum tenellum]
MEKQGWKGPKTFHILAGNMHEIMKFRDEELSKDLALRNFDTGSRILPQYVLYSQKYGDKFFYSYGPIFKIVVTDPNLVKEILTNKLYYKESLNIMIKLAFFGKGLFTLNGRNWIERRQIMEPSFHHEALKGMVNTMVKATTLVLDTWEKKIQDAGGSTELEVNNDMGIITSSVISRTTFGNNYKEGQQMFEQMEALVQLLTKAFANPFFFLPGYRFFPTPSYATTSSFLTWTMLLLAEYPEWQERARSEIREVCNFNNDIDATKLNQMKIVGMILNEVHRLFPILPQLTRVASKDMQLGDIFVPKGLVLEIPVFHMHHDPKLWGENVMEFDPNRFTNGVSKACQHQQSFIPFSGGPRYCLGQNFSLMESKVVVASVLSRFKLSVSPSYKHCPENLFLHSPKFGVQLIIKKLDT